MWSLVRSGADAQENATQQVGLGKPFKYIVTCVIMQRNGAGLHATSSCFWDNANDGSASYRCDARPLLPEASRRPCPQSLARICPVDVLNNGAGTRKRPCTASRLCSRWPYEPQTGKGVLLASAKRVHLEHSTSAHRAGRTSAALRQNVTSTNGGVVLY